MARAERVKRRLAAIMAADLVGYSRLMEADEPGTLTRLKTARRETVDPTIAEYGGRIVKTTGDGLLIEFSSVVDAVACAVAVQEAMGESQGEEPDDRRLKFRVGVHLGDIIDDEGGDIFGDGVNIAARLQELAEPGGVCISGAAHDSVRSKLNVIFQGGGPQQLKNIAQPVHVWRWVGARKLAARLERVEPALPAKPSIAVLPFSNMSSDPEQEYFSDGISEDIITELSRFRSLFVIARNSAFTYRGKHIDIRVVGRELGVRYVLEGSIRKAANRVRVSAQLIDALTGNHLWAERYDRDLVDIFAVQEDITRSIAATVAPQIESAEISAARRAASQSIHAYELALRARADGFVAYSHGDHARRNAAIVLAQQALAVEPDSIVALNTLAALHGQQAWFHTGTSVLDSMQSAVEAARRAIEIDPLDYEAHVHKGWCHMVAREYDDAISELTLAVELNPNAADALQVLGGARMIAGDPEQAIDNLRESLRLNPVDPTRFVTHTYLSICHFLMADYARGAEWARLSKREAPEYAIGLCALAQCYAGLGDFQAAKAEVETLRRIAPEYIAARLGGNSPFQKQEQRDRQVRLLRLAAGI